MVLGFLIYFLAGKNSTTTEQSDSVVDAQTTVIAEQSPTTNEQTATTDNTTNSENNDHPYVDLGLPSGTLWATCNIGANAPEEYGDYFAWGETEPKSDYKWSTLKYCKDKKGERFSKYNTQSKYGSVDNKTTLERSDDAASVNWGSDWCMPTPAQFKELKDNCTWTWTSINGNDGYEVKGPNDNTIFLPVAGYRLGTSLYDDGSYGNFWSSSLYSDGPNGGRYLNFYFDDVIPDDWCSRHYGFSVRPVWCR